MKRILIFVIALIFMLPTAVYAEEGLRAPLTLALVEVDTGAAGSSVNYFVLRPLMEYDNKEGIAEGTMFDGVVFSLKLAPTNAAGAEDFIATLFKDGTCISASDTVAGEMKEDGFLAKDAKYPVYAAVPCVYSVFDNDTERKGFCEYYIDTLVGVFNGKEFKNIELKGLYFSSDYDRCPDLRSYCIAIAKEKGVEAIASSTVDGVEDAMTFAANDEVKDRLSVGEKTDGYTLHLDGVPDESSAKPYDKLYSDYGEIVKQRGSVPNLLISFKAFNDVYDCASAVENTVPNENGRKAYELLKQIIDGSVEDTADEKDGGDNKLLIIAASFLGVSVVALAGYVLYRKRRENNGKQGKR